MPAVVGAWPEPFVHGARTTPASVAADPPLAAALQAAGAEVGTGAPRSGCWSAPRPTCARRDADWRRAAEDPRAAGLTAWVADGAVRRWDAAAGKDVAVPRARGGSRDRHGDGGVVFAVTGVDAAAATAAATAIAGNAALLDHRYAVVFDGAGAPVAYGGGS